MNSLRALQYEYNKRKSAMMELDYKKGLPVPTVRWTINEGDLIRRRKEVELAKLYKDAYLAWQGIYENQEYQKFGSSPVKGAYWQIYAPGPYVWKDHIVKKPCVKSIQADPEVTKWFDDILGPSSVGATMVFRRFPALSVPEYELDILVKALLGFPQPMGYKRGNHCAVLNDSWTINLRSTEERENIMMDAFLRGFDGQSEALKKAWEEKQVIGIDVSDELKDLLKVYTDAEEHLLSKEKSALEAVESVMKRYLEAKDERRKVSAKLNSLKQKMAAGQSPKDEDCDCDEDDEEE